MIGKGRLKRLNKTLISMVNPISSFTTKPASPSGKRSPAKTMAAIDTWYFLDSSGEVERKGQDTNGSGKPTIWVYYQNGQPVRSEEDPKSPVMARALFFFKDGKISRIDEDTSGEW